MRVLFLFIVAVVSSCTFDNYNFSVPLGAPGWIIHENDTMPVIVPGEGLLLGDETVEQAGYASVYQDFVITDCAQNITLVLDPATRDNSYSNDQQSIWITDPSTNPWVPVVYLFETLIGFNRHLYDEPQWISATCNVCDGWCAGANLTALGFSPLRMVLRVHQAGNLNGVGAMTPTALLVQSVCLE